MLKWQRARWMISIILLTGSKRLSISLKQSTKEKRKDLAKKKSSNKRCEKFSEIRYSWALLPWNTMPKKKSTTWSAVSLKLVSVAFCSQKMTSFNPKPLLKISESRQDGIPGYPWMTILRKRLPTLMETLCCHLGLRRYKIILRTSIRFPCNARSYADATKRELKRCSKYTRRIMRWLDALATSWTQQTSKVLWKLMSQSEWW